MALQRGMFVVSLAALAALAVNAALPSRAAPKPAAAAAVAGPGICTPHTNGNLVEDPPVAPNPHDITLYVLTDANGTHYCYKQNPGDVYREAPMIVVRNHDYFNFRLVNLLPHPGPRPSPYRFQGNCPVLPVEVPTPLPQSPTGEDFSASPLPTPFLSYLNRQRSVESPMPSGMPMPGMNPGDTNVHTHGLDTDPLEDNVFKSTVASKDGSCRYHIALYPHQHAGTYWYHAHLHGIAEKQVSGGLAGALIVLPDDQPQPRIGRVLLVKDRVNAGDTSEAREKLALFATAARRVLAANGAAPATAVPAAALTPVPNVDPANPPAWHSPTGLGPASTDCYGATPAPGATFQPIQIDGVRIPNPGENRPVPVTYQAVAHERYRIIDGMADGYLNVKLFETIGGKQVQKKLVVLARDGVDVGKNALAVYRDKVLVPPAGRLDLDVARSANPQTLVADGDFCGGNNGDFTPRREILRILPPPLAAAGARAATVNALAKTPATTPTIASPGLTDADKFLKLALATQAQQPHRTITFQQYWTTGMSGFYVTETSGSDPMHPKADFTERPFWLGPPADSHGYVMPTIHVHKKQIEHWTLVNAATQIHAFHIHQLTFVTLNNPFEPEQSKVFEDTTPLIPGMPCIVQGGACVPRSPGSTQATTMVLPSRTEIEIDFRNVPSGTWVFHCHMLFHEDHGMMGIIQVD